MRPEEAAKSGYEVTVKIPKLNGYFVKEFGPRREILHGEIDGVVLTPIGSAQIALSAPDRKSVENFLVKFQGADKNINPTRDAFRKTRIR